MSYRGRTIDLRRLLVGVFAALVAVLAIAAPTAAQDDGSTTVGGTLRVRNAESEDLLLEGVELTVTDADGNEIGVAVSDDKGEWELEVPGGGEYVITLGIDSLPAGVTLEEENGNVVTRTIEAGEKNGAVFRFVGEATTSISIQSVQLFVDGLKLGLIIAMCSIGLSLIYGTTGLVNFAHGEMVTFGATTAYLIHVIWHPGGFFGSLIVAALITFVLSAVAGGLFNEGVWKPLRHRGASLISALVVSIGFSILFRYIFQFFYGARTLFYTDYQLQEQISVFGLFGITPKDAILMLLSVLILVAVAYGLERTRAGKAMRAVADNRDLAESSGIDVENVIRGVWIVGSALAGLGGVFFGMTESIGWEMGFRILLLMFAGITLGGLGTAYGALLGSLIIGVFIQMSTLSIGPWPGMPPELKNVGALIVLVVILLVRPQGLLGKAERIG